MDQKQSMNSSRTDNSDNYMRLISRAGNYRKSNFLMKQDISLNYLEVKENSRLSLRKEKLENMIMVKRSKYLDETSQYEEIINPISTHPENLPLKEDKQMKVVSEEKSVNERFLNLSLNKSIDFVTHHLNRKQLCINLDNCIKGLRKLDLKSIKNYQTHELYYIIFKLKEVFSSKSTTIPEECQFFLYEGLLTILEVFSGFSDFNRSLIVY
jgi:hypothetical protein